MREKQKQLEALVGELNMEQAQSDGHKDAIARLQQEAIEMKRMWLAAKKKEQQRKQKQLRAAQTAENAAVSVGEALSSS